MSTPRGTLIVFPKQDYDEDCDQIEKIAALAHSLKLEIDTLSLRTSTRRIRDQVRPTPIFKPAA